MYAPLKPPKPRTRSSSHSVYAAAITHTQKRQHQHSSSSAAGSSKGNKLHMKPKRWTDSQGKYQSCVCSRKLVFQYVCFVVVDVVLVVPLAVTYRGGLEV